MDETRELIERAFDDHLKSWGEFSGLKTLKADILAAFSHLSASVPEQSDDYKCGVEDAISVVVQSCSCGSGPEFRPVSQRHHQIHCPTLVAPMIRALLGGQAPEQSPRVCVKCGHNAAQTCALSIIDKCDCVCEFPASVPDAGVEAMRRDAYRQAVYDCIAENDKLVKLAYAYGPPYSGDEPSAAKYADDLNAKLRSLTPASQEEK